MVGGIAAAAAVSATFPGPLTVSVRLGGGTAISQGLFIEMFATMQLVLTVIMLAAVKHKATYLAPIGIGIALFIGNLCSKQDSSSTFLRGCHLTILCAPGIYFSGAGINPTRAFGPDVVNHSFPGYHWIYWLGPALGSLLAAFFYHVLETLGWTTANPGQDYDGLEVQAPYQSKEGIRPGSRHSDTTQVAEPAQV